MKTRKKLTDITSSEGNLSRFSYICSQIRKFGYVDEKRLQQVCQESGIKHPKVIGRHIHILKTLDLVKKQERFYHVSSRGKVISSIFGGMDSLTNEEKTVYFQAFFKNVFSQLFCMLKVISKNEGSCRNYREYFEKNIVDYFSLPEIQRIWTKKTLIDSVDTYRTTGRIRRGIENKFETMLEWLENMDLIYEDNTIIALTIVGKRIFRQLSSATLNDEMIDRISLNIVRDEIRHVDIATDFDLIKSGYVESIEMYTSHEGLGDIDAINLHTQIKLAKDFGLYLDSNDVRGVLQRLQNENIIRSFVLNRKGKLALVQVR